MVEINNPRMHMLNKLIDAAERDPRVVGLVDYGSGSEGRSDEWSDVDVAFFIVDTELEAFRDGWVEWASQFGTLLLAYVGGIGHPWTVYDTGPVPLRVDFAFHAESALDKILSWPNSPLSAGAMVLYDNTGGKLTENAQRLVGQWLGPEDRALTFASVCGDFWYYMLRTYGRLQRGQEWAARQDYHLTVLGFLISLLRLETGEVGRWRAMSAAVGIEGVLTVERLAQLDACIPGKGTKGLQEAMRSAVVLGREVCGALAGSRGWAWPEKLSEKVLALVTEQGSKVSKQRE
jgi:hypothetical protein